MRKHVLQCINHPTASTLFNYFITMELTVTHNGKNGNTNISLNYCNFKTSTPPPKNVIKKVSYIKQENSSSRKVRSLNFTVSYYCSKY